MHSCGEIMSKNLKYGFPDMSASDIAKMMNDNDVGIIPIVQDEHDKSPLGIITDRDLVVKVLANDRSPQKTLAREIMVTDIVTTQIDDDIEDAIDLMKEQQVRRIVVLNQDMSLSGIISQGDIANKLKIANLTAKVVEATCEPREAVH